MLHLEILSPEKKIFDDSIYGVILPGVDGHLEILNNHAPLVSALKKGNIKILSSNNKTNITTISINTAGFVEVLNNKVSVVVH